MGKRFAAAQRFRLCSARPSASPHDFSWCAWMGWIGTAGAPWNVMNSRRRARVLVLGIGSLGRLTAKEIRDRDRHREVVAHLRFDDQKSTSRLHAELAGAVGDLETVLRSHAVDEVYVASTSPAHAVAVQRAIETCERLGVPFAVPACEYRLFRAKAVDDGSLADGFLHFRTPAPSAPRARVVRLLARLVGSAFVLVFGPALVEAC